MPEWTDVPDGARRRWSDIFEQSRDGVDVAGECPVCARQDLHRWFDATDLEQTMHDPDAIERARLAAS